MASKKPINFDLLIMQNELSPQENPIHHVVDDFDDDDIQACLERLVPLCSEYHRESLRWHYDLGAIVRDHYEIVEEDRANMYGERFFHRLARDLNKPGICGVLLSSCRQLARFFPMDELKAINRNTNLRPAHILQLVGFSREEQHELINATLRNQWTPEQLFAELWRQYGPRRRPPAGKPFKLDKRLRDAYVIMKSAADAGLRVHQQLSPCTEQCVEPDSTRTEVKVPDELAAILQLAVEAMAQLQAFADSLERPTEGTAQDTHSRKA